MSAEISQILKKAKAMRLIWWRIFGIHTDERLVANP